MTKPIADRLTALYRALERTAAAHADLIDELRRSAEEQDYCLQKLIEFGAFIMESNYILTKYTLTFEGFQLANRLNLIPSDFVRRLLLLNSDRYEVTHNDGFFFVKKPFSRSKPKYFEDFEKDQLDIIADCETDEVIGRFLKPVYCQFRFFIDSGDGSEFAIETHSYNRTEANWVGDK